MTTQLAFRDVNFNLITRNNQSWLTSKEIANALGYATPRAVTKIFNQNQDEFTAGMTDVVEVPKSGTSANLKTRSRIFSLRGAHLIAMFARTEIAKEFRHWVLDVLDREVGDKSEVVAPISSLPSTGGPIRVLLDFIGNQVIASNNISPTAMVFEPSQIASFIGEPIFSDKDVAEIAEAAVKRLGRMTR